MKRVLEGVRIVLIEQYGAGCGQFVNPWADLGAPSTRLSRQLIGGRSAHLAAGEQQHRPNTTFHEVDSRFPECRIGRPEALGTAHSREGVRVLDPTPKPRMGRSSVD